MIRHHQISDQNINFYIYAQNVLLVYALFIQLTRALDQISWVMSTMIILCFVG